MAASLYNFPNKINRYKLLLLSLLLLSLLCFFLFNRTSGDLSFTSQTPAPLLVPRSPQLDDKLVDLRSPTLLLSNPEDNAGRNVTASSIFSQEDSNVEISPPVSSDSDLHETTQKPSEQSVSPKHDAEDDSGERVGEEEEKIIPISSNSYSKDETPQKTSEPSVSAELGLLKEGKLVPIASKSDIDDQSSGELEESSAKNGSFEEAASLNTEGGVTDNVVVEKLQKEFFKGAASLDTETGGIIDEAILEKLQNCDIYKGKWVKDEGYPIYTPGSCPYVDEGFNCQRNGRPDSAYMQWRWKPDECELPRFNATDFLVRLRGKRLMLVGDSMNRNQFESLLCLLREGLPDKSKMYETRGHKISKGRGYFTFKFVDYNCTVEFVRSHFLVREGTRVNPQGNSNPTLSIDRIDKSATRWQRADILVFNTGHWWTHGKTARGKNYYKEGDYIHPRFDSLEAYRRAINTWATWIKNNIKRDQLVFYRGYSSAHFRGGDWDSGGSCNGETEPVVQGAIIYSYPEKMTIVEEMIKETQVPVVLLNVTRLTNYRKDGHPSVYGKNVTGLKKVSTRRQDCSHWCLPGVPDAWNELIYSTLVAKKLTPKIL